MRTFDLLVYAVALWRLNLLLSPRDALSFIICHSLFAANYMYYKLPSRGLFDDDRVSCFLKNQNQHGSYYCPACLVRHRPDVFNPRTKETERFTLCKRCRSIWKDWGSTHTAYGGNRSPIRNRSTTMLRKIVKT